MTERGGTVDLPALEPLSIGRLIATGFALWRRDFGRVTGLVLLFQVPVAAITYAYMAATVLGVADDGSYVVEDADAFGDVTNFLGVLGAVAAFLSLAVLFTYFCRRYAGDEPAVRDILATALSRSPSYFVLSVVFWGGIAIAVSLSVGTGPVGVVFLLIGVVLAARFAMSHPAFWEEGVSPFVALARGAGLARGRLGELFGVVSLGTALTAVLYFGIGALLDSMLQTGSATAVILADTLDAPVAAFLASPILPALVTVAYFDARVRNEGYAAELSRRHG